MYYAFFQLHYIINNVNGYIVPPLLDIFKMINPKCDPYKEITSHIEVDLMYQLTIGWGS